MTSESTKQTIIKTMLDIIGMKISYITNVKQGDTSNTFYITTKGKRYFSVNIEELEEIEPDKIDIYKDYYNNE